MNLYQNFRYFYEVSDFANKNLVCCDGMGYEMNPSFVTDRDYINNNLLMFVLQGTLIVEQFQEKSEIEAGHGIIMQLTRKHKYFFKKNENTHIIWFHFRGNPVNQLLEIAHKHGNLPLIFKSEQVESKIYQLFDTATANDFTKEFDFSVIIYKIIMQIFKNPLLDIFTQENPHNQFLTKIDQYIMQNMSNKITLEKLAKEFNLSKYHFCRLFKTTLHTTPFEYIKFKKIEIAKKMLLHTNDSICDISNSLSFYDQGYFTNTFRTIVGCSPKQFRKNTQI